MNQQTILVLLAFCCFVSATQVTYYVFTDTACATPAGSLTFTSGQCTFDSSSGMSAVVNISGDLVLNEFYSTNNCAGMYFTYCTYSIIYSSHHTKVILRIVYATTVLTFVSGTGGLSIFARDVCVLNGGGGSFKFVYPYTAVSNVVITYWVYTDSACTTNSYNLSLPEGVCTNDPSGMSGIAMLEGSTVVFYYFQGLNCAGKKCR